MARLTHHSSLKNISAKQRGGIFLGLIFGLVVGLTIAVLVAFYIRRAPTPFISQPETPNQPSQTAPLPNNDIDFNRSLAGKNPSEAIAPAPSNSNNANNTHLPGIDDPQIVEIPNDAISNIWQNHQANSKQSQNSPEVTLPATTPSIAKNQAAADRPNEAQSKNNIQYYVQAGAYRVDNDAQQQRANLALQGFKSEITKGVSGSVTIYRVRLGPFDNAKEAQDKRKALNDSGIATVIIRTVKQ